MSTVGLKLGSLVIRTISKPIANAIKAQAREHPTFRRICIRLAQSIHRTDMRLRLGLLRDAATIERLEAAEKAAKLAAKEKAATSTLTTSTSTTSATSASPTASPAVLDSATTASKPTLTTSSAAADSTHAHHTTTYTTNGRTYHIRPLSETKAIDRGAAFISEFFLFAVAGSLILFESLRSRRKETNRQDIVTERLERLEERTRQDEARMERLEEEVWRLKGGKGPRPREGGEMVRLWEGEGEKVRWWWRWWPGKKAEEDGGEGKENGGEGKVAAAAGTA